MKILHTSDWHLGHILYGHDRTEEQKDMLEQMTKIVKENKPDVFLLSGDVYHTSQPSAGVQTMFTNALVKIHDANPGMTIVITAGNHDSGTKHDIFRTPWKALNVYTIGSVEKDMTDEQLDEMIIEIKGKGYIIAVPYVYSRNLPENFYQTLLDKARERNTKNLPVVLMAHTTVSGCDYAGHENATDFSVGSIDSIDLSAIGDGYDYLALGHIHHGQFVHSSHHHSVRYSGTPIAVSFDENYAHSVSLVEIKKHGDTPQVSEVEIENKRPLVTLPTSGFASWNDAIELLKKFPDDMEAYIRLNIEIEDFLPFDAKEQALKITEDKKCIYCHANCHREESTRQDAKIMTIQEFKAEKPIVIAQHYAEDLGITLDDDMIQLFNEAVEAVEEDKRNINA